MRWSRYLKNVRDDVYRSSSRGTESESESTAEERSEQSEVKAG